MAEVSTSGLEELLRDLEAIAQIPDDVILEILEAEAEVIEAEQKAQAAAMLHGSSSKGIDLSKGITADSITHDKKLKTTSNGRAIYVKPTGTRTDGNRRRKAEVAFVNEYGKEGQPARQFIRTANERAADAAAQAALKVYDNFLKSKNL